MAEATSKKTNRIGWVLMAVVIMAAAWAAWKAMGRMNSMDASAAAASQFEQFKPGDTAKIMVEVSEAGAGTLTGKILEKESETVYKRSEKLARVSYSPDTKVVMGKTADIKPAAVLHITGAVGNDHALQAQQIVVLTGYVRVE
jgi:hypothetical protein